MILMLSTASSFLEMLIWMGPPSGQSSSPPIPLFPPAPPRVPPPRAVVFGPPPFQKSLVDLQFHISSSHWPPPHLIYWVLSTLIPPISFLLFMSDPPLHPLLLGGRPYNVTRALISPHPWRSSCSNVRGLLSNHSCHSPQCRWPPPCRTPHRR